MRTTSTPHRLLLTLPDVAALARVQRPVVSMWRSRSARTGEPFPPAQARSGDQELFDAHDVARWLEATRRGNNSQVREELSLFAAFDQESGLDRRTAFAGLTALLALKAATGEQLAGRSAVDLLDLADDSDPHDHSLYREIAALGESAPALAEYADAMSSAAYTPSDAFEALMAHRFRLGLRDYSRTALAPEAIGLVAGLAASLADSEQSGGAPTFVDPWGGSDLLVAVRDLLGEVDAPVVALGGGDAATTRLARRRLATHGWLVTEAANDGEGRPSFPGTAVVVAQLPAPGAPALDDDALLKALDDVALAMGPDARAVILAPARALTGALRSRAARSARAGTLRTDRVRAIVRLPAGLLAASPRQQLALWVLGPAHPDVAIADRWTTVADLSATTIEPVTSADLLTDVLAAMGNRDSVHRHAFRFARLVSTSALAATAGDLVLAPRPLHAEPEEDPADTALRVLELLDQVNTATTTPVALNAHHQRRLPSRTATLNELLTARAAHVLSGNRLTPADIGTADGVRVIGTQEILGTPGPGRHPLPGRTLDRLTFSAHYPAGRYTEPGDIVFCTAPRAGAVVDVAGFSVVEYPARVLRLDRTVEPGLVPDVVARDLCAVATTGGWRTWPVRLVPRSQVPAIEAALARLAAEREVAATRVRALDALIVTVTDGVIDGALTLTNPTDSDDDSSTQEG